MVEKNRVRKRDSKITVNVTGLTFSDMEVEMQPKGPPPMSRRQRQRNKRSSFLNSSASSGVSFNPLSTFADEEPETSAPAPTSEVSKRSSFKRFLNTEGQTDLEEVSFEMFAQAKVQMFGRASLARWKKHSCEVFLGEGKILFKLHRAGVDANTAASIQPLTINVFEISNLKNVTYKKADAKWFTVGFKGDNHLYQLNAGSAEDTKLLLSVILNEAKTQAVVFDNTVNRLVEPKRLDDYLADLDVENTNLTGEDLPSDVEKKTSQITELLQASIECWKIARGNFHPDVFEAQARLAKWLQKIGRGNQAKSCFDELQQAQIKYSDRLRYEMNASEERDAKLTPLEELQNAGDMAVISNARVQIKRTDMSKRVDVVLNNLF
mmetsp:Transcript_5989/g.7822  ORF Transcript_5989/g.7822 Transcript_5989/m.7822 type:complete len:379 (+) Transcript_5989:62-1198(+)|eukprot:CAMPEP_0184064182 /NCGR_PEP_ID=MMETSP0957-20130417/1756_1 /TAXON_ID=627963 /ORGANISM="Aplanochytrium sp, Strain PBS07" /LENGTH=378 /DNA_ID=CAMNT_0026361463 /DNA_START=1 /DNA_END=1137 /DNA_ORIENTATION=+